MGITFNQIPADLRIPFVTAEFNNSQANQAPGALPYRALIIGQMTSGTATANSLYQVTSADQVAGLAGRGSMLHRQALAYFSQNNETETWIGVLADNGAGTAASGTLTVTGPATSAGTLAFYFGGTHGLVTVGVNSGDAQNTIATAINAAINATANLPVTSTVSTNVVTYTFRHKGLVGNTLDVRANYNSGDATPAGVAVAIVAPSGGLTNPTLTTLITNMGDEWFHVVVSPYTDSTNLTALETEMASRSGPMRLIDGFVFAADVDTYGNLGTLGNARNSQFTCIWGLDPVPTPGYECSAALVGVVAIAAANDPGLPFQTLQVPWIDPAAPTARFTKTQRNGLLHEGISTAKTGAGGVVEIERLITTYKTNSAGTADTSYLDVTTMLTLMYLRYTWRNRIASKYGRAKLADDGTQFAPGQVVVTPSRARGECVLWFKDMMDLGLVQDLEAFKTALVVQRNSGDVNRLDFLLPPTLINQFIVGAASIQFLL